MKKIRALVCGHITLPGLSMRISIMEDEKIIDLLLINFKLLNKSTLKEAGNLDMFDVYDISKDEILALKRFLNSIKSSELSDD